MGIELREGVVARVEGGWKDRIGGSRSAISRTKADSRAWSRG